MLQRYKVNQLPMPMSVQRGARAIVTDAVAPVIGSPVQGGGFTTVEVEVDGQGRGWICVTAQETAGIDWANAHNGDSVTLFGTLRETQPDGGPVVVTISVVDSPARALGQDPRTFQVVIPRKEVATHTPRAIQKGDRVRFIARFGAYGTMSVVHVERGMAWVISEAGKDSVHPVNHFERA